LRSIFNTLSVFLTITILYGLQLKGNFSFLGTILTIAEAQVLDQSFGFEFKGIQSRIIKIETKSSYLSKSGLWWLLFFVGPQLTEVSLNESVDYLVILDDGREFNLKYKEFAQKIGLVKTSEEEKRIYQSAIKNPNDFRGFRVVSPEVEEYIDLDLLLDGKKSEKTKIYVIGTNSCPPCRAILINYLSREGVNSDIELIYLDLTNLSKQAVKEYKATGSVYEFYNRHEFSKGLIERGLWSATKFPWFFLQPAQSEKYIPQTDQNYDQTILDSIRSSLK